MCSRRLACAAWSTSAAAAASSRKRLLAERQFTEILGVDVCIQDLEIAARRLHLETLSERQRARINVVQGALTYRDKRVEGFDAAALVEVIEHVDPDRLPSVERSVLEFARPGRCQGRVRYPG